MCHFVSRDIVLGKLIQINMKFFGVVSLLAFLCLMGFWLAGSPKARARLGLIQAETYLSIDGEDYGLLQKPIFKLGDMDINGNEDKDLSSRRLRIRFIRDVVTRRSLYVWAQSKDGVQSKLSQVIVTTKTKDGHEICRYELVDCKPLSWAVEKVAESQGGVHEQVEIAVQKVLVY